MDRYSNGLGGNAAPSSGGEGMGGGGGGGGNASRGVEQGRLALRSNGPIRARSFAFSTAHYLSNVLLRRSNS